ncbi:MAG: hypothetical protein HOO86_13600 [Bacteroidales bacterium]|nr:hypothetical protein [Bacteroidales bacterium]
MNDKTQENPAKASASRAVCLVSSFGTRPLLCLDLLCFDRERGSFVQTKGFGLLPFKRTKKQLNFFYFFLDKKVTKNQDLKFFERKIYEACPPARPKPELFDLIRKIEFRSSFGVAREAHIYGQASCFAVQTI